MRRRTYSNI